MQTLEQTLEQTRPWYREPWPWLLMAGPAAVIVAGIYTTVLAVRSDDGLVAEDYYKRGMAINQMLAREQRARDLNLSAQLAIDGDRVTVSMEKSAAVLPPTLRLRIVHPTRAGEDRELLLAAKNPGAYEGSMPRQQTDARRVILEDVAATWRIAGVLEKGSTAVRLEAIR